MFELAQFQIDPLDMDVEFDGVARGSRHVDFTGSHIPDLDEERAVSREDDCRNKRAGNEVLAPDKKHARKKVAQGRDLDVLPPGRVPARREIFAEAPNPVRAGDNLGEDRVFRIGFVLDGVNRLDPVECRRAVERAVELPEHAGEPARGAGAGEADDARPVTGDLGMGAGGFDIRPADPKFRFEGPGGREGTGDVRREGIPPIGQQWPGEHAEPGGQQADHRWKFHGVTARIAGMRGISQRIGIGSKRQFPPIFRKTAEKPDLDR